MDQMVQGVLLATHSPAVKVALLRRLSESAALQPISEDACCRLLAAAATIICETEHAEVASAAALIITQWGRANPSAVAQCAETSLVEPLLRCDTVPRHPTIVAAVLGWLLTQMSAEDTPAMSSAAARLLGTVRERLLCTLELQQLPADGLAGLCRLMAQRPAATPSAGGRLARALVASVAALATPRDSGAIAALAAHMQPVAQLARALFQTEETAAAALSALWEVISDPGRPNSCSALAMLLDAMPAALVVPACTQLASTVLTPWDETARLRCVGLLCDWLPAWPRCRQLASWICELLRQLQLLTGQQLLRPLRQLMADKLQQLVPTLVLPAVRAAAFPVVLLMLNGLQDSPDLLPKVAPRLASVLLQLRSQEPAATDELQQLLTSCQQLLTAHPQLADCCRPLTAALQSGGSAAAARLRLSSALSGVGAAAPSVAAGAARRRRARCGLTNLGNTCYMGALLQALFHSTRVRAAVLRCRPGAGRPRLAALQRVLAFLAFSERASFAPSQFQQVALPPWFQPGSQQDSAELLRYLLDTLQEETAAVARAAEAGDAAPSPAAQQAAPPAAGRTLSCRGGGATSGPPDTPVVGATVDGEGAGKNENGAVIAREMVDFEPENDGNRAATDYYDDVSLHCETGHGENGVTKDGGGAVSVENARVSNCESSVGRRENVNGHSDTATPQNGSPMECGAALSQDGPAMHSGESETPYRLSSGGGSARTNNTNGNTGGVVSLQSNASTKSGAATNNATPSGNSATHSFSKPAIIDGVLNATNSQGSAQSSPAPPTVTSLVRDELAALTETVCTCGACGAISRRSEVATELLLAVPEAAASDGGDCCVQALLDGCLSSERLTGDNQYRCDACGQLTDGQRQTQLLQPPAQLALTLARFVYDRQTGASRKLLTPVQLQQSILLPVSRRAQWSAQPVRVPYRLYAVVVHVGTSLHAGHYYCLARHSHGQPDIGSADCDAAAGWWRLDDEAATSLSYSTDSGQLRLTGRTDAAYMLFYRRCGAADEVSERAAADMKPVTLPAELHEQLARDNQLFRSSGCGASRSAAGGSHTQPPPPPPPTPPSGCGGAPPAAGPSFVF